MKTTKTLVLALLMVVQALAVASDITYKCTYVKTCVPPDVSKDFTFTFAPGASGRSPTVAIDGYSTWVFYGPDSLDLRIFPDDAHEEMASSSYDNYASTLHVGLGFRTGAQYDLYCTKAN